mmetsp:Transcript_64478/g.180290  ORF Transcript_64478/g.180290 Transcript_64478/m.180290 type:complete len:240 (-) Transcript_64478:291-1010(-)
MARCRCPLVVAPPQGLEGRGGKNARRTWKSSSLEQRGEGALRGRRVVDAVGAHGARSCADLDSEGRRACRRGVEPELRLACLRWQQGGAAPAPVARRPARLQGAPGLRRGRGQALSRQGPREGDAAPRDELVQIAGLRAQRDPQAVDLRRGARRWCRASFKEHPRRHGSREPEWPQLRRCGPSRPQALGGLHRHGARAQLPRLGGRLLWHRRSCRAVRKADTELHTEIRQRAPVGEGGQ